MQAVRSCTPKGLERPYLVKRALAQPIQIEAERCRRSLFRFMQVFWDEVSPDTPRWNWHIPYLCSQLMSVAHGVGNMQPRKHDLIINIPPGTTKSITCSVMFPAWCWTNWPWMRFIAGSYSGALSLELAEKSRDIIRSAKFKAHFPGLSLKIDKDTKSNFRITYPEYDQYGNTIEQKYGGNRFSTSVGGSLTGFHGHINIIDDPLDPKRAASDAELKAATSWMDQTLSTRKVDKQITATVLIMQRLAENDPTGHWLAKKKQNVKHICLPGDAKTYAEQVQPPELVRFYDDDGLLDPVRMPRKVLTEMEEDLGQYGYAGQVGQNPTPPSGGMFQPDQLVYVDAPTGPFTRILRYWDKAATQDDGCYTVGVKMGRYTTGRYCILDVIRGQWASDRRERMIQATANADGPGVTIWMEQEPGSAGKDSIRSSVLGLDGHTVHPDSPTGDKVTRADPFSVQVNAGNVDIVRGAWNRNYVDELRLFPFSKYKDQVDASSGAYNRLRKHIAGTVTPFNLT